MKRALAAVLIAVGFLTVDASGVSAQDTNVKTIDSSVQADCSKDVSVPLQNFVSGLKPGQTGQLKPNGCYLVSAKLSIVNQTNVTLDGNDATLRKRGDAAGATKATTLYPCKQHTGHIRIAGTTGASVKNLQLEGLGKSYAEFGENDCHYAEHAIEVQAGAKATLLQNITADRIRGDGLYLQGMDGLIAKNYIVKSNGRQGGAVSRGRNILLDGYKVLGSSRSGWDFEANGTDPDDGIYNVEIRDFEIVSKLIAFPSQGYNAPQDNVWIHDGKINGSLSAVYDRQTRPSSDACRGGQVRHNWKVERVDATAVGAYGPGSMVFCGTENVTVRDNRMPGGSIAVESSRGEIIVSGNCVKEIKLVAQTAPVQQSNNQVPCTNVPPSSSTTTTRPPTSTQVPPTSSTRPPVTTTRPPAPDTVTIPRAVIEQIIRDFDAARDALEQYLN